MKSSGIPESGEGNNLLSDQPPNDDCGHSLSPTGGPRIAKRSFCSGHPNCGGLGKPLGQGEGAAFAFVHRGEEAPLSD